MRNFLGHDGFIWWIGVVEDIDDPLTLGRCKVRCFGYHPAIKENTVPTEDLPWALAIHPLNTPNLYGAPRVGEWVFGFFLDALSAQEPAILGYIPGIPQAASEYFGATPSLTRNFNTVKQKESVVLDVNGTIIEILKDGNLNIKSNTHLTISSNEITISGNAISIFANNTLNISNTINITKEPTANTILIDEDIIRIKNTKNQNDTINIDQNEIIVEKDKIILTGTDEVTIDSSTIALTGQIVTMSGSTTLSITDFSKSFTPTSIDAGIELAKTLPVPSLP
jgi:hypothetical protein